MDLPRGGRNQPCLGRNAAPCDPLTQCSFAIALWYHWYKGGRTPLAVYYLLSQPGENHQLTEIFVGRHNWNGKQRRLLLPLIGFHRHGLSTVATLSFPDKIMIEIQIKFFWRKLQIFTSLLPILYWETSCTKVLEKSPALVVGFEDDGHTCSVHTNIPEFV